MHLLHDLSHIFLLFLVLAVTSIPHTHSSSLNSNNNNNKPAQQQSSDNDAGTAQDQPAEVDVENNNDEEEDEDNNSSYWSNRFRRGYKEQDNAYIRFGKRSSGNGDEVMSSSSLRHRLPSRRSAAPGGESAYIRFGKRGGASVAAALGVTPVINDLAPCSVHYLRSLPTYELRLQHLQGCNINRSIRSSSMDDGYIRFGKRTSEENSKCFYVFPQRQLVTDCLSMSQEELRKNNGVLIKFP